MNDLTGGEPAVAPASAPASAPAPEAPAATPLSPQAEAKAERARAADGRFARANSAAKQAMRANGAADADVTVESIKPEAIEKKPVDVAAIVAPEVKAAPPASTVTADPKTWPAPVQAVHAELTAKVQSYEADLAKWHEAGPKAVQQNTRLHEENKLLRAALEQAGGTIDQRDLDLIGYRVTESTSARMAEAQRARDEQAQVQQKQIAQARATDEATTFVADLRTQAKAAGVSFDEVGAIVHTNIALKRDPNVAGAIQQVKDLQLLRQRQAGNAAPSVVRQSIPAATTMPRDRSPAGKLARQIAAGFDVVH